jgi:UDP-N-acetylglucosamine 2-epimerase
MRDIDPNQAIDYILKNSEQFAQAKAERIYLEEFRKSKKALLMQKHREESIGAQEREAYAHPEYKELLEGLREAIEREEKLRWDLVAAQARVDVWRSLEASNRREARAVA